MRVPFKSLLLATLPLTGIAVTSTARAACTVPSRHPGAQYVTFGKLIIPPDATAGQVLFTSATFTIPTQAVVSCSGNSYAPWQIGFRSPGVNSPSSFYGWVPGMPGVQWLGYVNSGLGLRWLLDGKPVTKMASTENFATPFPGDAGIQRPGPAKVWGGRIQVEIILVNPRPSKPITSVMYNKHTNLFQIMKDRLNPIASTIDYYSIGFASASIEWPKARTCDTSNGNASITLGSIGADKLPQVGDSSNKAETTIKLSCEGNPIVDMTIQGTNVAGHPEIFGITPIRQAAAGVAVELSRNGNIIEPTKPYRISTGAGSTLDIPISARYVRIGDITSGAANASMTAAFTYN